MKYLDFLAKKKTGTTIFVIVFVGYYILIIQVGVYLFLKLGNESPAWIALGLTLLLLFLTAILYGAHHRLSTLRRNRWFTEGKYRFQMDFGAVLLGISPFGFVIFLFSKNWWTDVICSLLLIAGAWILIKSSINLRKLYSNGD